MGEGRQKPYKEDIQISCSDPLPRASVAKDQLPGYQRRFSLSCCTQDLGANVAYSVYQCWLQLLHSARILYSSCWCQQIGWRSKKQEKTSLPTGSLLCQSSPQTGISDLWVSPLITPTDYAPKRHQQGLRHLGSLLNLIFTSSSEADLVLAVAEPSLVMAKTGQSLWGDLTLRGHFSWAAPSQHIFQNNKEKMTKSVLTWGVQLDTSPSTAERWLLFIDLAAGLGKLLKPSLTLKSEPICCPLYQG